MKCPSLLMVTAVVLGAMTASVAHADVFNMGGTRNADGTWTGLASLETVPVGDPGNAADTAAHSGNSAGQGAVAYNYNIGKYEVTAGQYTLFLNAVAATDAYKLYNTMMWSDARGCKIQQIGTSGSYTYSVASDYANRPVNFVSWGDAARFANWLHNSQPGLITPVPQDQYSTEDGAYYLNGATTALSRETDWKWAVTSEDEWYKAAYYKGGGANAGYWDYATSSNAVPGRDMADASGNNANYWVYGASYPIDAGTYYTTVAGEFQNSDSAYGTFDQDGNVLEWNERLNGFSRGLRGGAFNGGSVSLLASFRTSQIPTFEDGSTGFRVVGIPEPSSLAMLGGIALTSLLYYWRKHA
jgi:formylglycine-generating enzyme